MQSLGESVLLDFYPETTARLLRSSKPHLREEDPLASASRCHAVAYQIEALRLFALNVNGFLDEKGSVRAAPLAAMVFSV